jgi:negative regulator of flagellin synthesis FlgM
MDPSTLGKVGGKIDDTGANRKVQESAGDSKHAARTGAASGDTVELTSNAKLLERLDKTLAALPVVDSNRVAAVKEAIENGDYEINADAIADAMIRLEQSLGN